MFSIESKGSFDNSEKFLNEMLRGNIYAQLDAYGREGVALLARATPVDSGLTADSWTYSINQTKNGPSLVWYNTNKVSGIPVAILIQYGHGTGTGGYVQGRDFINPVMQPLFDRIATNVWKAVTSA